MSRGGRSQWIEINSEGSFTPKFESLWHPIINLQVLRVHVNVDKFVFDLKQNACQCKYLRHEKDDEWERQITMKRY